MSTTNLFGYEISNSGLHSDLEKAIELIDSGGYGHYFACANPHSLVVASKDEVFEKALKKADILVPDGSGIVFAGKILDLPIREKVAGTDFFLGLCREANSKGGMKFFFLGSSAEVLSLIKKKMKRQFPNIDVCGTYSPPFTAAEFCYDDNVNMVRAVNNARPDVLWVGMTAPKQEKWIYENRTQLRVPFIGAIGAVFDFYAGTKERSSGFWIRIGLEWLPRFIKEPRRLWERNIKSTPLFLWWVIREKIRRLIQQH